MEDPLVVAGHTLPTAEDSTVLTEELQLVFRVLRAAPRRPLLTIVSFLGACPLFPGAQGQEPYHLGQGGIDGQNGQAAGDGADFAAERTRDLSGPREGEAQAPGVGLSATFQYTALTEVMRTQRESHRIPEHAQTHGTRQAGFHLRLQPRYVCVRDGPDTQRKLLNRYHKIRKSRLIISSSR